MVRNGIFNIALGSSRQLPASSEMDRPIWVGTRIGEAAESRPLTRLSAVPIAMNVVDSSITSSKMAADYVSSISVNGQRVTGKGSGINIIGGNGINLTYDDASKSLVLGTGARNSASGKGANAEVANDTVYWSEKGNHSTTPGTNYVGTSDSVAFEIHVNHNGDTNAGNGRVMRYEPMPTSANVIGGFRTNRLSTGVHGATIAGGGNESNPNQITGNFGTVSGGSGNIADDGGTVGGGYSNTAYPTGVVGGGGTNAAGTYGAVGGGQYNIASGDYTTVSGGESNNALPSISAPLTYPASWSTVTGGFGNYIYGTASTIAGGEGLKIGPYSFGFNGDSVFWTNGLMPYTDVSAMSKAAYFGNVNMMIGNVDSVARLLMLYGPNTDHSYGSSARYTAFRAPLMDSDVLYTLPNAQGDTNTVLTEDGHGNLKWASQLGALDWSITGNTGTHPPTNFIGTLDSQAFETHLFDTAAATGGYNRVMRYDIGSTSPVITGGSSANTIATPLSGAAILSGGSENEPNSVSDTFSVVSGGEVNTIDSGSSHSVIGGGEGNETGADHAGVGAGGGNQAFGLYSYVGGGGGYNPSIGFGGGDAMFALLTPTAHITFPLTGNLAMAPYTTIGAGGGNEALDTFASILGGYYNYAQSYASTIGGGAGNNVTGKFSTIAGGDQNYAEDDYSVISGGYLNQTYSPYTSILGGSNNKVLYSSDHATMGGGYSNNISSNASFSGIFTGKNNLVQDSGAVIAGGMNDSILYTYSSYHSGINCFIGAGKNNKIDGFGRDAAEHEIANSTAIVAGQNNKAHEENSFIGAGDGNTINDGDSFIGSGDSNYVNWGYSGIVVGDKDSIKAAYGSMIGAGLVNIIDTSEYAFIGSGEENFINGNESFIGAGDSDSVLDEDAAIASGYQNTISKGAKNSFIGAGYQDTIRAFNSFIGAGENNVTDAGLGDTLGYFASIPGGDHLRTQSYAQTALGFYNVPAGSANNAITALTAAHMDDPLVIVGNGKDNTHRGDAALISNRGHLVVFDQLGNAGSTRVDPIIGGTYEDNVINAWGDVPAHDTTPYPQFYPATYDFGLSGTVAISHVIPNSGVYVVSIKCFNPNGSSRTLTAAAINVTVQENSGEGCGYATVSKISGNSFTVHTYSGSNPTHPGDCNPADRAFFFTVVGR